MQAQLRGAERMRPNHHYSSHLAERIERYGPMSQIWTYSGKRLNYELKNTTSNRRSGGERELTFAKTFHRRRECVSRVSDGFRCCAIYLTGLVALQLSIIANNKDDISGDWASFMLRLNHADSRGTAGTEILESNGALFSICWHMLINLVRGH